MSNATLVKRSQEEIEQKVNEWKDDAFGQCVFDLLEHLDFDRAKPFLKAETTAETWAEARATAREPRQAMIDYMPFAWDKANDCRGLSAYRSMCHFKIWLWLDGDENIWPTVEQYEFYGKPQLIEICEYLGLDHKQWDDGERTNEG